jgi:hypothetical protein
VVLEIERFALVLVKYFVSGSNCKCFGGVRGAVILVPQCTAPTTSANLKAAYRYHNDLCYTVQYNVLVIQSFTGSREQVQ